MEEKGNPPTDPKPWTNVPPMFTKFLYRQLSGRNDDVSSFCCVWNRTANVAIHSPPQFVCVCVGLVEADCPCYVVVEKDGGCVITEREV